MKKPNCYDCSHRRELIGDCHSRCNNLTAKVTGDQHGIKMGWFYWPINFDPVWLKSCDGFSTDENDKKAETKKLDPLMELLGMLR